MRLLWARVKLRWHLGWRSITFEQMDTGLDNLAWRADSVGSDREVAITLLALVIDVEGWAAGRRFLLAAAERRVPATWWDR